MEQTEQRGQSYQGPERRMANVPYFGEERRRLDWPFKPPPPKEEEQPDA